ncbi:hypothetical protein [Marinobacter xiaoshiensis]|uniref:Uncharacterized protein n=1 Tax=Marinobacter xiaoshiensis TaxID=3073652 RepID=A0ABU2HHF3_9GAMM|nr:hypothetical protein [Marinobacter sp. F60267]MDS1310499.1 hypothetical protein [Marinobacter sp. F60267]
MNKYSDQLSIIQTSLFEAEALLNFMRKPEYLNTLLEADSPDIVLGAMLEKAWDHVANASGACFSLAGASDEGLKAELHRTALELIADGSSVELDKKAAAASQDSHNDARDSEGASIASRDDLSFTRRDESEYRRLVNWAPQRVPVQNGQWNIEFEMGKAMAAEVCALQRVNEDDAYNSIRAAMNAPSWQIGGYGAESGFSDEIAALAIVGMRALNAGAEPFEEGPIA